MTWGSCVPILQVSVDLSRVNKKNCCQSWDWNPAVTSGSLLLTFYHLQTQAGSQMIFFLSLLRGWEQSTLTELARDSIALCFLLPRHISAWNLACPEIHSAPFLPMYILASACSETATSALQIHLFNICSWFKPAWTEDLSMLLNLDPLPFTETLL